MAVARDMWNVSTKDEAVLWLWKAHNMVSDRISGDVTDDPEFRKIKFPSHDACYQCRDGFNFSEGEVLLFLKNIHSDESINSFGSQSIDEKISPESLVRYVDEGARTLVPGSFSLIVAIGFCVCIMFVAVFMFIPRKKRAPRKSSICTSNV